MISYLSNPHGELVWMLNTTQGCKRKIARIDLSLYLLTLETSTSEAQFRATLWNDMRIESATEELWQALQNEERHSQPWKVKAVVAGAKA